jgi:hypothetical protein
MDSFQLKPLTHAGIAGAIEKAKQYRLLNEPWHRREHLPRHPAGGPATRGGRVLLVLTLTDMFTRGIAGRYEEAVQVAQSLRDPYERAYFTGIVYERRAKATIARTRRRRGSSPTTGCAAR